MPPFDLSALQLNGGRDITAEIVKRDPLITDGQREAFAKILRDPSALNSDDAPILDGFHAGDLFLDVMGRAPASLFARYQDMALSARRFGAARPMVLDRIVPALTPQNHLPDPEPDLGVEAGYEHLSLGEATESGEIVVMKTGDLIAPAIVRHMEEAAHGEMDRVVGRVALLDPINGYIVMESAQGLGGDAKVKMSRLYSEAFPGMSLRAIPLTFRSREASDGRYVVEVVLPMDRPFFGSFEKYAYGVHVKPDRIVVEIDDIPRDPELPLLFEYADGYTKSGIGPEARPLYRVEATVAERSGSLSIWGVLQMVGAHRRKYMDTTLFIEGARKLHMIGNTLYRRDAGSLGDDDFPVGSQQSFFVAGPTAKDFALALWYCFEGREYDPAKFGIEIEPHYTPGDVVAALAEQGVGMIGEFERAVSEAGFGGVMRASSAGDEATVEGTPDMLEAQQASVAAAASAAGDFQSTIASLASLIGVRVLVK